MASAVELCIKLQNEANSVEAELEKRREEEMGGVG